MLTYIIALLQSDFSFISCNINESQTCRHKGDSEKKVKKKKEINMEWEK